MKIIDSYIMVSMEWNGPDIFYQLIKVHLLENNEYVQELSNGHFKKLTVEQVITMERNWDNYIQ